MVDMADRQRWDASAAEVPYEGFDDFFAAHYDRMARALALALGGDELGNDAASEAFARALQRWRTVATYENRSGWVYRVGLNWGRSRWRRRRRDIDAPTGAFDQRAPEPVGTDIATDLALRSAIRDLSDDHRAIVVARYYLDWSERDVAAALEIKEGTVKSRLHRALASLSDALEEHDGHD